MNETLGPSETSKPDESIRRPFAAMQVSGTIRGAFRKRGNAALTDFSAPSSGCKICAKIPVLQAARPDERFNGSPNQAYPSQWDCPSYPQATSPNPPLPNPLPHSLRGGRRAIPRLHQVIQQIACTIRWP